MDLFVYLPIVLIVNIMDLDLDMFEKIQWKGRAFMPVLLYPLATGGPVLRGPAPG